jgi:poly(A) polymerase
MEADMDRQPWMSAADTRRVMEALTAGGAAVRFVGGCVRDALLGRPVKDIDIATDAPPERVIELLEAAEIKAVPTGIEHGTVTAVVGGQPFEITTLRRDIETDGRHATVEFTDDWVADAARRDLTINALSLAPDGTLYDPFDGEADLHAGRIRFVGDPRRRIEEDVLRLLRWFRFYAEYGSPPPDLDSLAACREMAPRLPGLSAERVRAELLRLLGAPDPATVVTLMGEERVLANFLPEATEVGRLGNVVRIEAELGAAPDPILRLAALLAVDAGTARAVAERLRLSNVERDRLVAVAESNLDLGPKMEAQAWREAAYRLGRGTIADLAMIAWAGADNGDGWRELVADMAVWAVPAFPLSGKDAVAAGIESGPEVGAALRAVEDWWIAGDFGADRAACLKRLEDLVSRA